MTNRDKLIKEFKAKKQIDYDLKSYKTTEKELLSLEKEGLIKLNKMYHGLTTADIVFSFEWIGS